MPGGDVDVGAAPQPQPRPAKPGRARGARRLQLIVNPCAGGGRAARLLPAVEAALRGAGHDLLVTPTRSLAHADELTESAVAADRTAVAMGGDGTVGRVAGAAAAAGGVLGVLPGGRGNDFCRAVGISRNAVLACEVLSTGREQRIDLGYVGDQAFLGIASLGFDSEVQERVLRNRRPLGRLVYLYEALRTVASWTPATFSIVVDGTPLTFSGWSVAVCNSGVYGGGMRLAPDASLVDGRLDVVCLATTTRRRFLRALPKLFTGAHVAEPSVSIRGASSVVLDADRDFRVFADGDPLADLPTTVTVRSAALRAVLPA